jgi:hypothetical protein
MGTRKKDIRNNFLVLFGPFGVNIKDRLGYSWCDYGKSAADLQSESLALKQPEELFPLGGSGDEKIRLCFQFATSPFRRVASVIG